VASSAVPDPWHGMSPGSQFWSQLSSFVAVRERSTDRFASVDEEPADQPGLRFADLESERQGTSLDASTRAGH
jgi:hypothetical protein